LYPELLLLTRVVSWSIIMLVVGISIYVGFVLPILLIIPIGIIGLKFLADDPKIFEDDTKSSSKIQ